MNKNLSVSTISGRSTGSDNFTDVSSTSSNNSVSNGIPPVPRKKHPQRVFLKDTKKVNMNPMPIPAKKDDRKRDRNVIDTLENEDLTELEKCDRSTKMEMKALKTAKPYDNGYLIPSDPPTYTESNFSFTNPHFSFIPKDGSSNGFHGTDKPILRLDSGLGDGESLQGSGSVKYNTSPPHASSLTSEPSSPLSIQSEQPYEDIDHYNRIHEYPHHLHHHHQQRNDKDNLPLKIRSLPVPNDLQPLPQMNISGVTVYDSEDFGHVKSAHMSDLVSGNLHDPSHAYMQLNTSNPLSTSTKPKRKRSGSCRIVLAIIVILLISLAALILSIIDLVSKPGCSSFGCSGEEQTLPDLNQALISMQQKIDNLVKENEVLMMQQKNLTSLIEQERVHASTQLQNLSFVVESMNVKFETEIANISLTPGPQGPPGIANFSLCVNRSLTTSAPPSASATTETSFLPSDTDLQKYFVTFAYCTYSGATDSYLEAQYDPASTRQRYRCKCWGQVSGVNQTICKVFIWMCPHES